MLSLSDIDYLGNGSYACRLQVRSCGFACDRRFDFDNDEYFLNKARGVMDNHTGEAELMDLQADSYIRLRPFDEQRYLIAGYIVEETQVTQSIEFGFCVDRHTLTRFIAQFEQMVRANV